MADETPQEPEVEETPQAAGDPGDPPAADEQAAAEVPATEEAPQPQAETEAAPEAAATPAAEAAEAGDDDEADEPAAPREKPAIPGADLEVDIVLDGDSLRDPADPYAEDDDPNAVETLAAQDEDEVIEEPIAAVTIDLGAEARYRATGKRKSAVARVTLRPGTGAYTCNGKDLATYFPRETLQRNIRQPLEAVGYDDRLDVICRIHGGGVAAQAGALRHGISRALLEADPNLRLALKQRGFLTRDARVKERKKAGLKKARKRPQFSKR